MSILSSSKSVGCASLALAAGLLCAAAQPASATVLTFDFGGANFTTVPQVYGDRVGGQPQPPQFSYGAAGGLTPNVTVTYYPTLKLADNPNLRYGDFQKSLFRTADNTGNIMEIDLIADPGYLVCLYSFEMAAQYNVATMFGEDLPAKSIKVLDANNVPLYQAIYNADPLTVIPGTLPLRHNLYDFGGTPICLPMVRIVVDLNQIMNKVEKISIDNITFGQSLVPAPGSAATMLLALGAFGARRRR